jgi:large subunit ribosomal protein L18
MKGIPKRRRAEAKTDYGARLSLLKADKPRFVVRKTNRYVIAQLVVSKTAQDSVVLTVSSKDLLGKGWPADKAGSLKSLPAAYLTGILFGNLAKKQAKEAVLDIGMHRNVKKSRIYAVLKGAVEAGLIIRHSAEALPSEKEITSKSCGSLVASLKGKL